MYQSELYSQCFVPLVSHAGVYAIMLSFSICVHPFYLHWFPICFIYRSVSDSLQL
jgi:hypothetical protein